MLDVEQTSCVHTQMSQTPQHSTGKWIQVSLWCSSSVSTVCRAEYV